MTDSTREPIEGNPGWLGIFALAAGGFLMATAMSCADDEANADDDDGSVTGDDGTIDPDTAPPVLTADFEPICEPGTVRCAGGDFLEVCAGTGLEWESEACPNNTECVICGPEDGCTEDRCLGPCEAMSLVPSSAGCSFIANRQIHQQEDTPDGIIVANPDEEQTATVSLFQIEEAGNVEALVEEITLVPGGDYAWDIANEFVSGNSTLLRSGGMFRIRSDYPIIAYQHAPKQNFTGNDSSLLLPDDVLGTVYVVTSYAPHFEQKDNKGFPSYFEVIALEKNTTVEWWPPVPTAAQGVSVDGVAAGGKGTQEKLNRYDTLRIAADNDDDRFPEDARDLSGTVIRSDKPIWVVGGSRCSRVPVRDFPARGSCDPLQEVLLPVSHWGAEYVAAAPPDRGDEEHHWRIYGGVDGPTTFTTVPQVLTADNCPPPASFEDGFCTLPQRGAWIEITVPNGESFVVRGQDQASDVLMAVGYLQSRRVRNCTSLDLIGEGEDAVYPPECPQAEPPGDGAEPEESSTPLGDPAMYQAVPTAQFLSRYVFRTAIGFEFDFVQVIRPIDGPSVFLNEVGIQEWTVVDDEFEYANVLVDEEMDTHTIQSSGAFGIVQFGYTDNSVSNPDGCLAEMDGFRCASSYAHPGGMKAEVIIIP